MKRVYTIGSAAEKIEAHIAGAVDVVHAETLPAAVAKAHHAAEAGDIVCWPPPAPASTSSKTTSIAAGSSKSSWHEEVNGREVAIDGKARRGGQVDLLRHAAAGAVRAGDGLRLSAVMAKERFGSPYRFVLWQAG